MAAKGALAALEVQGGPCWEPERPGPGALMTICGGLAPLRRVVWAGLP